MAEYRDVESLTKYLFSMTNDDGVKDPYKRTKIHAYRDVFERLLASPIIPTELKISRLKNPICPNCGRYWLTIEDNLKRWFCPRCGARMDGVTE